MLCLAIGLIGCHIACMLPLLAVIALKHSPFLGWLRLGVGVEVVLGVRLGVAVALRVCWGEVGLARLLLWWRLARGGVCGMCDV